MNDRFKFRAWDDKEKMAYFEMGDLEVMSIICGEYVGRYVKDHILMQSTGLKDKNGALIYEGDILRFDDNYMDSYLFAVSYGNGTYDSGVYSYIGFICTTNQYKSLESDNKGYLIEMTEEIEIIGNIHETPELLKAAANG